MDSGTDDPGILISRLGSVICAIPTRTPTGAAIDRLAREIAAGPPGEPLLIFFVMGSEARIPDSETREQMQRLLVDLGERLESVVAVVEGAGFIASAKRSVLTFVTTVLRGRHAVRVHDSVPEAAATIEAIGRERAGLEVPTAPRLVHAVKEMRQTEAQSVA